MINIWHKDTPSLVRSIKGHSDFVRALALCQQPVRHLVSAGEDCKVCMWDVDTGECLSRFPHECLVWGVVLYDSLLLTACDDNRLRVWHIAAHAQNEAEFTPILDHQIKH